MTLRSQPPQGCAATVTPPAHTLILKHPPLSHNHLQSFGGKADAYRHFF